MARFNPSRHYCSSKPVEWLRTKVFKIDKPKALPWGGWEIWDEELKSSRPIAFFLTEVLPVWVEVIPNYTVKYLTDFRQYVRARNNYSHGLTSNLEKGQYHDMSSRMMHSLFDSFVNYIEVDEAYSYISCGNDEVMKKYNIPFTERHSFLNWGKCYPVPQAGIDKLKWEMNLDAGNSQGSIWDSRQSDIAVEKMTLYTWWTVIRPARGDSWVVSGFRQFWDAMDEKYGEDFPSASKTRRRRTGWLNRGNNILTVAERKTYNKLSDAKSKLEQQWEDEDDAMLLRLVKIRRNLWT